MAGRAVVIDCDPGVDDAVALLLAFGAPELDVVAVTTVAGNVGVEHTARNARIWRQVAGASAPVYAGCDRPWLRAPVQAGDFHGESGLGAMAPFEPAMPLAEGHAVDAIIAAVMDRPPGAVTLAVTGPMTNIALAMSLEPAIVDRLGEIVVMGGARSEGGNITASAEFNVFADPHAAAVVFERARRVVAFGLDATHQVRATPARIAAIKALATPAARAVGEILDFSAEVNRRRADGLGPPLHDPCVIAYLLAPELFTLKPCRIAVETDSPLTLGATAVEFRLVDPAAANAFWATHADADGMFDLLLERLA